MRNVLLVSYTFPPQYDVSARRAAKLCKYLPAAGWRPVVLTKDWVRDVADEDRRTYAVVPNPDALQELAGVTIIRAPYHSHDNVMRRLHQRLGGVYGAGPRATPGAQQAHIDGNASQATVRRARTWTPRALARRTLSLAAPRFGDFPDAFRGWIDGAVRVGVDAVRLHSIEAIVSLCPPASAHVVASEIARETGVPWVAQFDDLYSFHLERQRRAWRGYSDRQHRRWMRRATLAGAITPAMLAYVTRTYGVDGEVVMVGFDPEDSPQVEPVRRDRMRIAYTGSVYPGDQRPEIFFEALDRVLQSRSGADSPPPIEVVFAGTGRDEALERLLASYPAAARACAFVERLAPRDALRLQRNTDALLLLNCTAPSASEGTLSFPAKSFEYLNAGKPILAVPSDPGGWGDRLLESTRSGVTVRTAADAAEVIAAWLDTWQANGSLPYAGKREEIARYGQPVQAATLARLLDRAVATRGVRSAP